jgi:diguanylate cyclase (GGDEF)-like protein
MSEKRSRGDGKRRTGAETLTLSVAIAFVIGLALAAWGAIDMLGALSSHAEEGAYLASVDSRLDGIVSKAAEAEAQHRAYSRAPDPARLRAVNEAVTAMTSQFTELLKLTATNPGVQTDLLEAKAQTEKKVQLVRDAIEYQSTGDNTQALAMANQIALAISVREVLEPVRKQFDVAFVQHRATPHDIASSSGYVMLGTWLAVALLGLALAALALRESRASGRLYRKLRRESIHDSLTGLPNNVYLEEWLSRSIARANRSSGKVGVAYVDVVNFKQVNQALGYGEGDRVLVELAQKLRDSSRAADFVARVRNDSFAVIMADVADQQQLEQAMARFGALSIVRSGIAIRITVGGALFPEDAESADNLVRLSRAAMYRNRQSRRTGREAREPEQAPDDAPVSMRT